MAAPSASSLLWLAVREPELGPNATLNRVLPSNASDGRLDEPPDRVGRRGGVCRPLQRSATPARSSPASTASGRTRSVVVAAAARPGLTGLGPRRCAFGDRQAPRLPERPGRRPCPPSCCLPISPTGNSPNASRLEPLPVAPCLTRPPPLERWRWPSARSRPDCGQPVSWSGSATGACGRRSPAGSSGPVGHQSSGASVLRIQVHELTLGLVDAVAVIRRGQRAVFIALRLEAVAGRWELIELLY
jgi:Family of unknown function (DUF6459)